MGSAGTATAPISTSPEPTRLGRTPPGARQQDGEEPNPHPQVEQFNGEGRVAARGFRQDHFVPGQLFLMDDDVVGFLWLPIGTFVVFSRVPEEVCTCAYRRQAPHSDLI